MTRYLRHLAATAAVIAAVFIAPAAAQASDIITVASACTDEVYVNGDEGPLAPTQEPDGLQLGPEGGIFHIALDEPIALAAVPVATFTTDVETGPAPLIKMETAPYSTINIDANGKFWSSRIAASDPGGQSQPVDEVAELKGKWSGYTDTTTITTVGVGYGHDEGPIATVTSLTFGEQHWNFACQPGGDESSSPSPSPSTSAPATSSTPSPHPSSSQPSGTVAGGATGDGGSGLPITGPGGFLTAAVVLLAVGAVLFVFARRRRTRFTS
ncbi:hypothetical protein HH310_12430 [Actinoplanes sp. TBRC 11911]|uniref:hypothetical protein n=1 Tax=Actinoplanes sp. TBRC 11911 TaxID=2729386 RepID=UPI00145EE011|nr:hypothetical protein [Actinoplanes sp. TBRC 11911]NMO52000.1 hypothetical protein [Actinoplanes sp. TBRC 11911]